MSQTSSMIAWMAPVNVRIHPRSIRRVDAPGPVCTARPLSSTKGYLARSVEDIATEAG